MKRIALLLLCFGLLLTGLAVPVGADNYDSLRQEMKESFLNDKMLDVSEYKMTKEQLQLIYDELYHSGELPWYADEDCSYVYGEDLYVSKFRPKVLNPKVYDRDTYEIKIAELIRDTCLEGMEDWQIVLSVHEYITSHVCYDESLKKNTGYDALVNGTAACYGYAQLFMDVMKRQGIPCKIAVCRDTGNGAGHAWNVVQLDGSWYHVDATWDDPVPDIYGYSSHIYFLRTDKQFKDPAWRRGFDWETDVTCTDTAFAEDWFWEEKYHAIAFLDGDTALLREETDWEHTIYSLDIPTGEKTALVSFRRKPLNLGKGSYVYPTVGISLWQGRVYYNTETKVYSMRPDGTDRREEYTYNAKKNKKYICSLFVEDGVIHLELANHRVDTFENLDIPMENYVPHTHSFAEKIRFFACAGEGSTWKVCDCGLTHSEKVIQKTNHIMLSQVLALPTKTQTGTVRQYCAVCDHEEQITVPPLPEKTSALGEKLSSLQSLFDKQV